MGVLFAVINFNDVNCGIINVFKYVGFYRPWLYY